MTSPIWQIHEYSASLRLDQFSAKIELDRPDRGLVEVRVGAFSLANAQWLGVAVPSLAGGIERGGPDCYQRGPDLIAAYRESQSWPVRVDVVWRAISPAPSSGLVAGVDLIVSVHTELLDSRPELAVRSDLAPTEILRLVEAPSACFEPCRRESCLPLTFESGGGPGCFVFRLPGVPLSYAEMSHPADFRGAVLAPSGTGPAMVEVRHRLFAQRLEKGVILRARVRGVVVDRAQDLRSVAACYAAFAAAEPPLGT